MSSLDALVGISVSEPGAAELEARGLTDDHVRHVFVELARQILAAGGSLAYGGDLRHGGYTRTLLALLRTYSRADRPPRSRVRAYLARPAWKDLGVADESELAVFATPLKVPAAGSDADDSAPARARDFTAMRRQMTMDIDARVVIGGRLAGQVGRWPGVVEEAYLAVRARKPLLVAGALGGAAARVAEAVRGQQPPELTTRFQLSHTTGHDTILTSGEGPDEEDLLKTFAGADLRNGLSEDDNRILWEADDLDLVVALVLRGLRSLDLTR